MKTLLTAIASLSLLATPLAAAAQTHRGAGTHSGGTTGQWSHNGGGDWNRGGTTTRVPGWDRDRRDYRDYRGYRDYRTYPRYYGYRDDSSWLLGGLGFGLAAGALLSSPSYYDYGYSYAPYYDYPRSYSYGSQPCGRWVWDDYRERYIWDAYVC